MSQPAANEPTRNEPTRTERTQDEPVTHEAVANQTLDDHLTELRRSTEQALQELLPGADEAPGRLHEAMRYAVFAGGKRLRPTCCLLAAESVGGRARDALPAACAVELIHTYSLVHDDLPSMDDDDLRRGRPTVHRAYDEAIAILVGDGLQTLAFESLARGLRPEVVAPAVAALAKASGSRGMVGGQVADLEAERRQLGESEILAIALGKTAALFGAAFELGGWSGGGDPRQVELLAGIGVDIGIAFQIVDDLLDRTATAAQMGKATGKDDRRGKATLPSLVGPEAAYAAASRRSDRARASALGLPAGQRIADLIDRMLRRVH